MTNTKYKNFEFWKLTCLKVEIKYRKTLQCKSIWLSSYTQCTLNLRIIYKAAMKAAIKHSIESYDTAPPEKNNL